MKRKARKSAPLRSPTDTMSLEAAAAAYGDCQPKKKEELSAAKASEARTCSVGIQHCSQHMDADADNGSLQLVKAVDEKNALKPSLPNGSCADEAEPTEHAASSEDSAQQQLQDQEQEAELAVSAETEVEEHEGVKEQAEEAAALTEAQQEMLQPMVEDALSTDRDDVKDVNQLPKEEAQPEEPVAGSETKVEDASAAVTTERSDSKEDVNADGDQAREENVEEDVVATISVDPVSLNEIDRDEIDEGPQATEQAEEHVEYLVENTESKEVAETLELSNESTEKLEKKEEDVSQVDKNEQDVAQETIDSTESQEAPKEAEAMESTTAESTESKIKLSQDMKKKKTMETKKAPSAGTSKLIPAPAKTKQAASRPHTKAEAENKKDEQSAVPKPKKTPVIGKRPTALPTPPKAESDETHGIDEHKATTPVRRTSATRTIPSIKPPQQTEEVKDAKAVAAPTKTRQPTVRKTLAATTKDEDEKAVAGNKPTQRRSITAEKPVVVTAAAAAASVSTREKTRVGSAADATSKTFKTKTFVPATPRRATVGDTPAVSANVDSHSVAAAESVHSGAAKMDELRRSNSSQLSKTESGGSSEVFPDGGGAGGTSKLRAPSSRVHRVTQRTPDCTELQHVTKATPMPESRGAVEIKQTAASRGRMQKLQEEANRALEANNENQYLTPLQRKESEVKELRRLLQEAYQAITDREEEIEVAARAKAEEIGAAVKDKEDFIAELQAEIDQLTLDYQALTALHGEVKRREEELEREVARLRQEMEERERRHQQYYLEMYRKGQESAKFERQDELEKLAVQEPDKVSIDELVEKLELTQQDLHKWQTLKLMETYSESEQPATEADAKLRFLRDSMFHYLTEKDRDQGLQHLTAIIGIFNFTEVQMATIMKCLADRKKRGKI